MSNLKLNLKGFTVREFCLEDIYTEDEFQALNGMTIISAEQACPNYYDLKLENGTILYAVSSYHIHS